MSPVAQKTVTSRKLASSAANVVVIYQSSDERVVTVTAAQSDDVAANAVSDISDYVAGVDEARDVEQSPTCAKS